MIHYKIEMDGLHEIEAALGMLKDKSKHVLRTAINNTAKDVIKLLPKEAAEEYYIRQTEARKTLSRTKATMLDMEAIVYSTGHALELYGSKVSPKRYNPSNRPPAGHTGNVKQANSPKYLYLKPGSHDEYKAFVVKYNSRHISIAQRVPGTTMRDDPNKEGIKNLYTASIPNMLNKMLGGEAGIFSETREEIEALLERNIELQIARYLK